MRTGARTRGRTWGAILAATACAATVLSLDVAAAATGPTFDLSRGSGEVGTSITITNGGCTSEQLAGDAIALYRADGAWVDVETQLGNDPSNRRPWSTALTVQPTLQTPAGATQSTTPGEYVVALFCDIGSSWRPPSDPAFPISLADADLTKPFTVTGADGTAPTTSFTSALANNGWATSTSVRFAYASSEAGSRFDCTLDGSPADCPASAVTLRSLSQRTHDFTVAARDTAGNVDATPVRRTFTVPRNNTALSHGAGWAKKSGTGYFLGTFSQATRRGATLRLPVSGVRRLALVASTGPQHGAVTVFLGPTKLDSVSLATTTLRKRRILPVTTRFGSPRSGTVRIVVTSAGRTVRVEGLGVATR